MAAIEVRGLVKEYPGARALDGVDVTVERGEIVGLLGPNGAGKTTLLRTLAGTLAPTDGTATIDDLDVVTRSLEVRRRVGYLPEHAPLYPEMTPRQYLRFMAAVRRVTADADLDRAVERCGVARVLDRPIGHLSKGYRQRVGLAQAILHWPATLLLDEPTSGLDPNQIAEIRDLIREIGRERTVILSSHILSEVEATCDRVLIIDAGRIVGEGTPADLAADTTERHAVTVELADAAAADALPVFEQVDGVRAVAADGERRVTLQTERDVRADLFRAAVEQGWTLQELHSERRSLESVYRALVSGSPDFDDQPDDSGDET